MSITMNRYIDSVTAEMKNAKAAFLVIIFTIVRLIYGFGWVTSGLHKLTWFSDGNINSAGVITRFVANIAGPEVTRFDPLYINKAFAWIANTFFLGMPGVTDTLVVILEITIGISMILGFRIFWFAFIAMFMNTQFIASGSFNNFGYIWTNLAMMKFSKYAELIGIDGFLRAGKGKNLLTNSVKQKLHVQLKE
ncbi:DoxX family protein [Dehalobacter sp. DCM]|uniref:DoxX family protein n=1 Tax=Dehalobacter sp. DCM TaxID=2907827 RepID=UPI00308154BA|nr:DoxX family protein [Dehalobacter sp. DCM]